MELILIAKSLWLGKNKFAQTKWFLYFTYEQVPLQYKNKKQKTCEQVPLQYKNKKQKTWNGPLKIIKKRIKIH